MTMGAKLSTEFPPSEGDLAQGLLVTAEPLVEAQEALFSSLPQKVARKSEFSYFPESLFSRILLRSQGNLSTHKAQQQEKDGSQ